MTKAQIKKIGWTLGIIFVIGCIITMFFWDPMLYAVALFLAIFVVVSTMMAIWKCCKHLLSDWIYDYRLRGCLHSPTDEYYFEDWEYDIKCGRFNKLREHLNSTQADNNMHPMAKADRLKLIDRLEKVKRPFKEKKGNDKK